MITVLGHAKCGHEYPMSETHFKPFFQNGYNVFLQDSIISGAAGSSAIEYSRNEKKRIEQNTHTRVDTHILK